MITKTKKRQAPPSRKKKKLLLFKSLRSLKLLKSVKRKWGKRVKRAKEIIQPRIRPLITLVITTSLIIGVGGFTFWWYILKDLPSPEMLTSAFTPQTSIIRDRNGQILYKIYKSANRIKLPLEEIPTVVTKATVAIEDSDFYNHPGISLKSIIRAFLYNLQQKDINLYQGGSTLTQQLVKLKLVGSKKTYQRKAREIILALLVERQFSKDQILTMYLNEVGYGGPAYGIEAASQMYFGISAKNLTLGAAAFLAGLPAAPTTFSPFGTNPELALIRQKQVLARMFKLGMIGQEEYEQATSEKLVFAPQKVDILAPHFVMFAKDRLVQKFGEKTVSEGGLDVITTLDLNIQHQVGEIIKKNISELKDLYNIHNAAALITIPSSSEILAMVGSVNYFDIENKGYVNVTTSLRQPGSAVKPVNYAYAFDHGYTPTSVIEDAPVVFVAPGAESYAPVNYDGRFHGIVTLRSALANSYNIPAIKILNSYGVKNMIEEGKKMGVKSWENIPPIGLSLTLGGAEVTMLDLTRVYGTLANLGVTKELKIIKEIRDSNGEDITSLFYQEVNNPSLVKSVQAEEKKQGQPFSSQTISPLSAYWITDILADNIARLPAFGPYAKLTIPNHKVAVKTGTSQNFRDNWTIGFTPDYLTAVWVGNNDGSFMNKNLVSGITGAAPIWNEIMSNLLADTKPKDFPVPTGLVPVKICAVNGLLTCPYCPQEKTEYFTADKVPTQKCFFKSPTECEEAKKQAEGKSEEEKKQILWGCTNIN